MPDPLEIPPPYPWNYQTLGKSQRFGAGALGRRRRGPMHGKKFPANTYRSASRLRGRAPQGRGARDSRAGVRGRPAAGEDAAPVGGEGAAAPSETPRAPRRTPTLVISTASNNHCTRKGRVNKAFRSPTDWAGNSDSVALKVNWEQRKLPSDDAQVYEPVRERGGDSPPEAAM